MKTEVKKDFNYSRPVFFMPSEKQDKEQGIDGWICGVPFAYRKRRKFYMDITIRYRRYSGAKTEYLKILDGSCLALIYFFDFPEKVIICSVSSIRKALQSHYFTVIKNTDGDTELAVIPLNKLKPLVWEKSFHFPQK